jgi:hypothetical protein
MPWIDNPRRVSDEPYQHACFRIRKQLLAKDRLSHSLVKAFLPGKLVGVDGDEGAGVHGISPDLLRIGVR